MLPGDLDTNETNLMSRFLLHILAAFAGVGEGGRLRDARPKERPWGAQAGLRGDEAVRLRSQGATPRARLLWQYDC